MPTQGHSFCVSTEDDEDRQYSSSTVKRVQSEKTNFSTVGAKHLLCLMARSLICFYFYSPFFFVIFIVSLT